MQRKPEETDSYFSSASAIQMYWGGGSRLLAFLTNLAHLQPKISGREYPCCKEKPDTGDHLAYTLSNSHST